MMLAMVIAAAAIIKASLPILTALRLMPLDAPVLPVQVGIIVTIAISYAMGHTS